MKNSTEIILACGGPRPLARALGIPSSTVSSWGERDSIPARHDTKIVAIAKLRGVTLSYKALAELRSKSRTLKVVVSGQEKTAEVSDKLLRGGKQS